MICALREGKLSSGHDLEEGWKKGGGPQERPLHGMGGVSSPISDEGTKYDTFMQILRDDVEENSSTAER